MKAAVLLPPQTPPPPQAFRSNMKPRRFIALLAAVIFLRSIKTLFNEQVIFTRSSGEKKKVSALSVEPAALVNLMVPKVKNKFSS